MKTLQEFISSVKSANIFLHPNPDPDAIGAGLGLQWLLDKHGIPSVIYYTGAISHPMNRALVNKLGITMEKMSEEAGEVFGEVGICVDCTPEAVPGYEVTAIIDHHRNTEDYSNLKYVDIRNTGSASSIIYSHIKESGLSLNADEDQKIIISLLLGVKTDTRDLLADTVDTLDYAAHQDLTSLVDSKLLTSILDYPLPRYFYDLKARAYVRDNYVHEGGLFVTYLGIISEQQKDTLAIIADEMVRMDGVSTAVVGSIVEDSIVVSLRTSNVSLDASKLVKRVFGEAHAGAVWGPQQPRCRWVFWE